jgi:hypothetical protein
LEPVNNAGVDLRPNEYGQGVPMLQTKYFGSKSIKFNTPEQGATDAIVLAALVG